MAIDDYEQGSFSLDVMIWIKVNGISMSFRLAE